MQTISDSLNVLGEGVGGTGLVAPGWFVTTDTWTYASATTFTVTGDVRFRYPVGTALWCDQSGNKWFSVARNPTYSAPNTTVTVTGGSDYTLANAAIGSPRYSYAACPSNFPARFSHTPATVGWAATPTIDCDFTIVGRRLIYYFCVDGTSNADTASLTLPVAASVAVRGALSATRDSGIWSGAGTYCKVEAGSSTLKFYIEGLEAAWAVSDLKTVVGSVVIPI